MLSFFQNGWVNAASGAPALATPSLVQRTRSHGPLTSAMTSAAARFCPEHHMTREQANSAGRCSCAEVEAPDSLYDH